MVSHARESLIEHRSCALAFWAAMRKIEQRQDKPLLNSWHVQSKVQLRPFRPLEPVMACADIPFSLLHGLIHCCRAYCLAPDRNPV